MAALKRKLSRRFGTSEMLFTNSCDVDGTRTVSLSSAFTFLRSPPLRVVMFNCNKRVDFDFTSFRGKQFILRGLSEGLLMFLFECAQCQTI